MVRTVAEMISAPLKRRVREAVLAPAKRRIDGWVLGRAVEILRRNARPGRRLLRAARRAWGNEAYSADLTYLHELIRRVANCKGPILECGTGLTTIMAGVVAEKRGVTVWSLEQDQGWAEQIGEALGRFKVHNVVISRAPLREYDGFVWYDLSGLELPKQFELVLCDGPAVHQHWGGVAHASYRYGLLPVLASHAVEVKEILLDDADDPRTDFALRRWHDEFGARHRLIRSADGDCAVVTCG